MKRIGYFIRRRYLVLVALFLILSVPLCIFISQKKILYKAQAQIAFTGNVGSFRPEIEARRIIADDLLTKLSKEFPGVDKTALKEDLQLDFDKEHILAVGFVSPDPKLAREVANAAARLFIGERDNVKKRTRSQRQEKLASAKRKIGKARYALNSTKKKLTRLKDKNAAVDNRVADLQKRLGELESRREEFLKIFTYKHPDVVYLTSRRDSVKAQLEGLPDNSPIYKSLSAQIDEEAIVFSKAESEYESLNSYYKGMPDDWDVKLTKEAALPTVPMGRPKGWYYMWGLLVVFLISVSGTVILEILDKKVHTREELQQQMSVPVIAEIDKAATGKKAGFLGVLFRKSNIFNPAGNPRLLRVYEQLFTFLKLEVFKGSIDKKIIMIASAEPDSGKTSVACNLALAAAKNGEKVLLIDADLRHPSVGEFFGLKSSEKGFSDILKGAASDKDVVRNLTDLLLTGSLKLDEAELRGFDNLKILLSGGKAANPLGLLEAKEVSELFKRLSQEYGMLVIDTAALRGYADGFNIVDAVDSLLLVTRRAGTPYPLLKSAISQIRKINGPLTGLVFNHV